jgi:glutamate racemase
VSPTSPIIVLDSGLGGLTVARAIRSLLPKDEIVYFGDTARLPYGSKSAATVTGFVKQIIAYLRPLHPKHVVIACNTATALALPAIRAEFPTLSISGVIDPGARAAALAAGAKPRPLIGVIATEATIRSKAYNIALHRRRNHALLMTQAAPLLAPIIEEGRDAADPLVRLAVRQYICPLVDRGMDVLVLGCTHYPILAELIAEIVGPNVQVIDSAEQCAQDVAARVRALGLMRVSGRNHPSMRCFVTDDPERFQSLGSRFLGLAINTPELVSTERLSEALREFKQQAVRLPAGPMQLRGPVVRNLSSRQANGLVA